MLSIGIENGARCLYLIAPASPHKNFIHKSLRLKMLKLPRLSFYFSDFFSFIVPLFIRYTINHNKRLRRNDIRL